MSLAVVLGAGRGMGLETGRFLGGRGYEVVITDRDPQHAEAGRESLEASGVRCRAFAVDGCDYKEMEEFARQVITDDVDLDALVCCIGGSLGTPRWVDEVQPDQVRAVIDLCTGAALKAVRVFREALIRARGAVLIVSSAAARYGERQGWSPPHAFGKGAVLGMVRYLSCDPEWSGVRWTSICPGDTATERTDEIHSSGIMSPEEVEAVHTGRSVFGRMASPAEMGEIMANLITNTFATGIILDHNGGEWPTPP